MLRHLAVIPLLGALMSGLVTARMGKAPAPGNIHKM